MPPNRFESEVESFLEGSHGDRTHIKRADHHTVTPLCGTLLWLLLCCTAGILGAGPYGSSGALHTGGAFAAGVARLIALTPSYDCQQAISHVIPR